MQLPDIAATILLIIGLPWLVFLGYKRGGAIWAILILFFSLIAGFVFCVRKKEGWIPWLLILAACIITFYSHTYFNAIRM